MSTPMSTNYVYRSFETGLWTVGFFDSGGKWYPESDHDSREAAGNRVHYLNGGNAEMTAERDTLQAENTRLREALEMTIGFCVAFREDVSDWPRFPQVGILFSKVTAALAAGKGETR